MRHQLKTTETTPDSETGWSRYRGLVTPARDEAGRRGGAVRLYLESDPKPTIRKLAQQLGVHHEALRNWIRHADTGQRPEPPANDLAEENSGCINRSPSWSG
ncbi:transposase [Nocardia sp. NPDC050193]